MLNLFASLVLLGAAMPASLVTPALHKLDGPWIVDLRPSVDAPAHPMPMALTIAESGVVTGTFYSGPIDTGRASDNKGRRCFAFTTADRSGPYHTSGCLTAPDTIEGQTWSEGRNFLLTWTATRDLSANPK